MRTEDYVDGLRAWIAGEEPVLEAFRTRPPASIRTAVEHDRGLMRLLHDAGWSRFGWPTACGGLGGPILLRAVLYDELARAGIEIPEAFVILETLGPVLAEYAPRLAARHLPAYLAGTELWGQGFSEPEAGSDLAQLRTRAVAVDGGFRVYGQKTWTTLGQLAQWAAVLVRTGAPDSAHRGLSMLWIDLASPGVVVRPIRASSGRDEFAEMFFEDVLVPTSGLIGPLDGGWAVAMFLLQYERGMYAWQRQAVLHSRIRDASEVAASGPHPVSATVALGRAALAVRMLRARSARTVRALSVGRDPGSEISIDKVLLAEAEQLVFDACRQLSTASLTVGEDDRSQVLREEWFYSRASSIFGGAIDIQRDIVADRVLALPRAGR